MAVKPKPLVEVRDNDGFAAIGDYAILGDGRGTALIAPDGAIDWWAVPRLDSPPAFAGLLDPDRGGRIELRPTDDDASSTRRYLPHTNLLETTFITSKGTVRVTDSLNSGSAGALPWSELARRIDGLDGAVKLSFAVRPGDGMRAWEPWTEESTCGCVVHAGTITLAARCSPEITPKVHPHHIETTFTVKAGERRIVAVVAADDDPLYLCDVESIDHRIDVTAESWKQWSTQVNWDGPGREQIVRSALALKTLVIAETGAVAAAATTSLPESVGGTKNWDYRFAWVRDAALTIDALSVLGLQEEVHAAVRWLLHAIREDGPDIHVMYALNGSVPGEAHEPPVPGYRHSRPVMIGNKATTQTQLGVYGDLFGTVADWVFGGHVLDGRSVSELSHLADRCADTWQSDDAGIWELQTNRPYTSSKMNCWRALDAAARLAQAGQLPGTGQRWKSEAATVKAWIEHNCWSELHQAYTFYAGTDDLDASVLLAAQFGYDNGKRMSTTIDAISNELGIGALLYRYSGAHREEETFTACAFWRVHALVAVGRADEASDLLSQLEVVPNDLGLMSEMSTPGTHEQIGNIPQALSHLAFIRAANALRQTQQDQK